VAPRLGAAVPRRESANRCRRAASCPNGSGHGDRDADGCFAPPLVGPTVLVVAKAPAPLLGSGGATMAMLLLLWVVRSALAARGPARFD